MAGHGALSKGDVTSTTINVNFAFSGLSGQAILYGGGDEISCGHGSGSGSHTYTHLQPSTNYTFYLHDDYDDMQLASITIKTLAEEPPPPPPPPFAPVQHPSFPPPPPP